MEMVDVTSRNFVDFFNCIAPREANDNSDISNGFWGIGESIDQRLSSVDIIVVVYLVQVGSRGEVIRCLNPDGAQ